MRAPTEEATDDRHHHRDRLADVDAGPLLLPERPRRFGPTSRRLLGRLVVALALVELVGTVLVFASDSETWRAFGLGLVYPGAGLLYDASPILFVVTQVLVLIALVLWWGLSTHFSIPLVWFGTAVLAAVLADGPRLWVERGTTWDWAIPVAYVCAFAVVATMVWKIERRFRTKRAMVPELNAYLADAQIPERVTTLRPPDHMDAELLRWCYSFAEQPDDGLAGMDWGEQFHGGTQLRYQLNSIAWAMSLYAANYLPERAGSDDRGAGQGGAQAHRPAGVGLLAHAEPARQLRPEPRPDPPRQHHVLRLPRRRRQQLRGGHGRPALRRAGVVDVRVEGRPHVRVRPPFAHGRRAQELRTQPARVLPVRAGMVVHRVQRDGRAGAPRPRHDPWLRRLGSGRRSVAADARRRVPDARRFVRAHPLEPHRRLVGHGRGPRRALPRQRHAPLRRRPARPCAAGPGARPAGCGAEDGDAVEHGGRRNSRPWRCRPSPSVITRRRVRSSRGSR